MHPRGSVCVVACVPSSCELLQVDRLCTFNGASTSVCINRHSKSLGFECINKCLFELFKTSNHMNYTYKKMSSVCINECLHQQKSF